MANTLSGYSMVAGACASGHFMEHTMGMLFACAPAGITDEK